MHKKETKINRKILCLVQLPPPIHGAAVMNSYVVSDLLPRSSFKRTVLPLDFSKTFEEMHGRIIRKILMAGKTLFCLFYRLLTIRPHIVYFTFSPFGTALFRDIFLIFICRRFNNKVVLHLHGTGIGKKQSKIYKWAYSYMFKKGLLLLLSECLYEDVSQYIEKSRCRFIPNAVARPNRKYKGIREQSEKVTLLYMANYHPKKGLLTAVNVLDELVKEGYDVELVLAGAYTFYWSKSDMKYYLDQLDDKVSNRINVFGPAYGNDKEKLFRKSDIFIYPSQHDAFPLVLLEALSNGLPIIASNQGAIPSIVNHGECGAIITTDEVKDYSDYVKKLIADKRKREEMACKARECYEQNYSYEVFDKKFIEILQEI